MIENQLRTATLFEKEAAAKLHSFGVNPIFYFIFDLDATWFYHHC